MGNLRLPPAKAVRNHINKRLRQLWQSRTAWVITPVVAGLVIGLRSLGWFQPLEWMAYDQFIRLRPAQGYDDRILIIGITEQDLQTLNQYPMDDATLATLLDRVRQAKPRAIGLDIYRDFSIAPGTQRLQTIFKTTPNLIGIEKQKLRQNSLDQSRVNTARILREKGQTASNNIVIDNDGKLRRGMLYWIDGEQSIEYIGLRLAMMALEARGILPEAGSSSNPNQTDPPLKLGRATFQLFESNDGGYVGADAGGYQIMLNYRGPAKSFRTVSMTDVLQGKIAPRQMRDRIVLIGPVAESIQDFFYTPYSGNSITTPEKTAGVEIIATIASQVMTAADDGYAQIKSWSDPGEWAWIALWAVIGASLAWWIRSPKWATGLMLGLIAGLVYCSYLAFLAGWWIPLVPPIMALAIAAIAFTGYVANLERQDRAAVMNLFGRYVTPTIAEAIWRDREQLFSQGRLKGRKMPVTVLFTDLKDFSTIAERTDPEVLMDWLNEYMEAMTQVVLAHGAVVDKFIGDAIMALFGVPIVRETEAAIAADSESAVKCAIDMAVALAKLNAKWAQEGRPTLKMRVGICTGMVVTGSLGGQQRMDYTAIGDTVNIAARLESYDKSIEGGICRILISDTTYDRLTVGINAKSIGSVHLKGREQETLVYQILYDLADVTTA
jgi:adenylate cyclase